jgi:hypothetical protein
VADCIKRLGDEYAKRREQLRWRKCGEQAIPLKTAVLVLDAGGKRHLAKFDWHGWFMGWHVTYFTHWMFLPTPPETQQ